MKRIISFVMCLCMLVGLMPAAVMAEGESVLPEGYEQMYDGTQTSASRPAPIGCDLQLTINGVAITDESGYTVTCSDGLGEATYVSGHGWNWVCMNGLPGTSGYIYAEKGGEKYALPVSIDHAEFGVYTDIDANVTAPGSSYVIPNGPNYTIDFTNNGPKTVYIIPGYDFPMITGATSSNSEMISATVSNGIVTVSLANVDSGSYSTEITLSFVWSTTSETETRKIYVQFTGENSSGDDTSTLPADFEQLFVDGQTSVTTCALGGWGVPLTIKNGKEFVSISGGTDGYSVNCDTSLGSITWTGNGWHWDLNSAIPGSAGYMRAEKGAEKYAIPVTIGKASFGVYLKGSLNNNNLGDGYVAPVNGCWTIDYSEDGDKTRTAFIFAEGQNFKFAENVGVESDNEKVSAAYQDGMIVVNLDENATGTHNATITFNIIEFGRNNTWETHICFTDGTSGGNEGGGNNNNGIGDLILGAHATQPSELYNVTDGIPSFDTEQALSQFSYQGETYYFGVGREGIPFFTPSGSMGISMVPNQYDYSKYGIVFYVKEGDGYVRIQDAALAKELFAQFTELNLKIWAIEYSDPGIELTASETFPAIYNATIDDCFSNCLAMQIGLEHKGNYIITASGNYNGEVLSSYTYDTWDPRYEIIFEYDETSQLDYIAQVNAFLNNVTADASASVIVNMPEGIYNGYIHIPAQLGNMDVSVYGSFNQNTGELLTTINGGIICSSSHGTAFNINFVGAGKDNAEWPTGSVNAGQDNYAFMGIGDIRPRQCRISDFNIALYGEEKHINSRGSLFVNNGTAIYFGKGESTGDPIFEYNTFIGNDIAIDFTALPDDMATSIFSFKECVFIDNDTDIYNRLDRRIYIPGCYFAETIDGKETTRACVYKPIGNQQGEGVGNLRKQVLYYPQAANKDFTEYIYDTNTGFYGGKNPIVSVNFTKTFPIPAGALDGVTLDVMKHDELLARIDFNTASSGSSSGGARAFSARSGSSSEATFDATVEVERSEDGSTITIKLNDFPGGKRPTVSVPNTDGWTKAAVADESGAAIKAEVTDEYISFVAPAGGTYTLTKVVDALIIIVPPAADDEEDEAGETVTNPDGSTTTTVTDKETGAVTETTETPDGISTTVVTDKDGVVTDISAEIPADADTASPVTLPIEVKAADEAEISIKTNSEEDVTVEIPVSDAGAGTVAVLVDVDGNETVIQQSALTEKGISAPVPDGATIKIVDNSKDFEDVSDEAWYAEAIDFASAREIVNGMGDDSFQPKATTNRAMIWTMLARLDGVDTRGGDTWYEIGMKWAIENGISDGTNALSEVTREQIVTMFWRYMGEPESDGDLSDYTDGHETSAWATKAKAWAVDTGLIQGMGDGTLNPGGNANRAQVAQMIMNLFAL